MYLYLLLKDIQLTVPEKDMLVDSKMVVFTQAQVDVVVNYVYRCTALLLLTVGLLIRT
jgi:hypothetical protein